MSRLFDKQVYPDRPWEGRGYGRIRLDESLARDLKGIMYDVVNARLNELHEAKKAGEDTQALRGAVKRASTIRERVSNLIREQGWEDAE